MREIEKYDALLETFKVDFQKADLCEKDFTSFLLRCLLFSAMDEKVIPQSLRDNLQTALNIYCEDFQHVYGKDVKE